jgi:hypothetical protein
VICVVEGQTENAVLDRLVAPYLGQRGVDFHVPIVTVGRGRGRGGVKHLRADDLYDQLRRFLRDRRRPWVTTLFDYYGFPDSASRGWEFVAGPKAEASFRGAAAVADMIEHEIRRRTLAGIDLPDAEFRLFPYLQLYELEALLFAEPEKTAAAFGQPTLARRLSETVVACGGCEQINDGPQSAPSKRIQGLYPDYVKGRSDFAHGPRIAERLDLATVREACPRFSAWLTKLEGLKSPAP